MDLRHYVHMLGRQRWLILVTAVVVAVVAGLFATMQTSTYSATTQLLLRPSDPTETLGTAAAQQPSDLGRYVAGEAAIVQSLPVAQAAAHRLATNKVPTVETPATLLHHVSVQQSPTSNVLGITAKDRTAVRARDIANAFALAYIDNRKSFDVGRLQDGVSAIQTKLDALQARINALTASASGSSTTNATQQADLNAATTQYSNLLSEQQNLQVEVDLKHGEAEIISPAELPAGPSGPSRSRDVLIGLFAGLLLGVALALVREQMDTRIRSIEDAEQSTGLALLGQIPIDPASQGSESYLIMRDDSTGAAAEAIRSLRTAVLLHHDRTHVPLIVITSPGQREGKTLVAANLAASFAESGKKTLLVSADLRNPRLERMFGLARRSTGLGDYVRGDAVEVASVLVPTDVRHLFLLKAGTAVSNPAGIFTSETFETLLAHATEQLDVIVFDTPPVLAVADATVITARADEVLLVVAENETGRGDAQRARALLESAAHGALPGLVVNKVPSSHSSFDSYYRPAVS